MSKRESKPIRLRLTPFSHEVVAITSYTMKPGNLLVSNRKQDVTKDFEEVCLQYLAHLAEAAGVGVEGGEGHKYLIDGLTALVERVNARHSA